MNLRNILTGWYKSRFEKPTAYAIRRRAICAGCGFNSKNRRGILYKVLPAACTLCKCEIRAKTAAPGVACPLNKWLQEMTKEDFLKDLEKRFG